MEKWFIKNKNIDFKELAKETGISPIISKILINRGIFDSSSIKNFLYGNMDDIDSKKTLHGVDETAEFIKKKIREKKKIRIVGDYDVDGIMSVYILYKSLLSFGALVDYVIPNRINEGYGLNLDIIREAKKEGIDTIITCDNGISAFEACELAKELAINLIITDHHDLSYIDKEEGKTYLYPQANFIINPKNPKCTYDFKDFCGAGVVYKLVEGIYKIYDEDIKKVESFLDYVAIATICDVVDLLGENRIMVKQGLNQISKSSNIGLQVLLKELNIKGEVSAYHVGFIIGPTFNASGRLESAYLSLELLLEENEEEALIKAKNLYKINEERKAKTLAGFDKALDEIKENKLDLDKVILVYKGEIHESVAGIIAGRIRDLYNRPVIVLTDGKDSVKGSARSIENYNIFEKLSQEKDLLREFGGHPMAAGLSLEKGNISILRERLNKNSSLKESDLLKKVYIDMALAIEYISYKNIKDLKGLEPYGKANSRPIFGDRDLKIRKAYKLAKKTVKLSLQSKKGNLLEALIFNGLDKFEELVSEVHGSNELENLYKGVDSNVMLDIVYYPSINDYMGKSNIQIIIKNFRIR